MGRHIYILCSDRPQFSAAGSCLPTRTFQEALIRLPTWESVEPGGIMAAEEYEILLCTGGPAVRIVGDLDEHNEPSSVRLEYQDWFTPWNKWHEAEEEMLLRYARYFYFG